MCLTRAAWASISCVASKRCSLGPNSATLDRTTLWLKSSETNVFFLGSPFVTVEDVVRCLRGVRGPVEDEALGSTDATPLALAIAERIFTVLKAFLHSCFPSAGAAGSSGEFGGVSGRIGEPGGKVGLRGSADAGGPSAVRGREAVDTSLS